MLGSFSTSPLGTGMWTKGTTPVIPLPPSVTVSTTNPFSDAQQYFINQYRSFLSFRRQAAPGSAYILPVTLGDEELWEDLRMGMNFFNSYPPIVTTFRFQDIYNNVLQAQENGVNVLAPASEDALSIYTTAIFYCALFHTGIRIQWFEAGKHFVYNDNGISIQRTKQGDYQNIIAGSVMQYITGVLPKLRLTLGYARLSPKGQFSGMISLPRSLTRGLRGTRLGFTPGG